MNFKVKRIVSLFLLAIMATDFIPTNVFAAIDLPNWDDNSTKIEKVDWRLPSKTKVISAGMAGPDPVTNVGVSFLGHFIDDQGRTVLKGKHNDYQTSRSDVWKNIAFKFDKDLYEKIDFENSYMMRNDTKTSNKFTDASFLGKYEKVIPFETLWDPRASKRYFYLVLKDGETWESVIENGGTVVQTRLYDKDANRVWSKHLDASTDPDAQLNYNTYTQSFAINNLLDSRDELVYGAHTLSPDYINTAANRTVFIPSEGKLRTIYQYTKELMFSEIESQYKAFRQGFSNDFANYLKEDESGAVANIYIKNHKFQPYDTFVKQPIKLENLNISEEGTCFIVADSAFNIPKKADGSPSYNAIRLPAAKANKYIFPENSSANPVVTIVEYNIDTEKIEKDKFQDGSLASYFTFDSAYLEDSKPVKYFEYVTSEDIKVPTGANVKVNFNKTYEMTSYYQHHADILFGNNKALDLIYGESAGKGIGEYISPMGMHYYVDKGFTIPAGTSIKIVNYEDKLSDLTQLGLVITDPTDKINILNTNAKISTDTMHRTEIMERSDILSAGIVNKTSRPLVHEIFTNSPNFSGLNKLANDWVVATLPYKKADGSTLTETIFAYDNTNLIPSTVTDPQKYAIPTEKFDGQDVGKKVSETIVENATGNTINKTYSGLPYEFNNISEENKGRLQKDMPIQFIAQKLSNVKSEPVIEQVQAKVNFDLNGGNIDGKTAIIEKIAPLNKEFSRDLTTGDINSNYKASGFEGDNLKLVNGILADHNGQSLVDANLAKRQFPGKETVEAYKTANPVKDTQNFLGWSTKKLSTVEEVMDFAKAKELKDVANWADVDSNTAVYKFTATSPIDKARTVYAVYGQGSRPAENIKQAYDEGTDTQSLTGNVIDVTDGNPVPEGSLVKLVDASGQAILGGESQQITATIDSKGNFTFPLTGLKNDQEVYFVLQDPTKDSLDQVGPVKLDLAAPTEDKNKKIAVTPDLFSYMVKITGRATDPSKILKVTVKGVDGEEVKANFTTTDEGTTIELNDDTLKQLGQAKSYTVTIYDTLGNKLVRDVSVKAVLQELVINIQRPRANDKSIIIKTQEGVALTVKVKRGKNIIDLDTATTSIGPNSYEKIVLKKDSSEFTLQSQDIVIIKGRLIGHKNSSINLLVR